MKSSPLENENDFPNADSTEKAANTLKRKAPPAGIEPAAPGLGNLCSIRLS
jgi:hypothetical protein